MMIISEKPIAAKRIADAIDHQGEPREIKRGRASYFECHRGNDTVIVVYALGHLFELKQTESGWTYPRLETEWVPKYEVDKKAAATKPIIDLIHRLSKDTDQFYVATDFDIEGSLIGYLTLKYACGTDPTKAKRMRFSSLTGTEIASAYENPMPTLDFPLIESGHVRHEIDWLYGINLTRALTLAVKRAAGWFKIVSTGRVQGPALAYATKQEQKINLFVPVPFWSLLVTGSHDGLEFGLEYSKGRIATSHEARMVVEDLQDKTGRVTELSSKKLTQHAPEPFNLSTLQSEAYRHFAFRPSKTLQIAQQLYLDALISYPRTGSQQIPPSIDVKSILQGLGANKRYSALAKSVLDTGSLVLRQGPKSDPAHPAIHPTGVVPAEKMAPNNEKVYDLIVRRFLAAFGKDALKETLRADIAVDHHVLHLRGLRTIERGWLDYYRPYALMSDKAMPSITKDDLIRLVSVEAERRLTTPPPRYNPSSLMKALENDDLGTKATRAGIVDSLKSRGYALNDRFEISALGYAAFETLERYVPKILSPEFTRELEREMERVQQNPESRDKVLEQAKAALLDLLTAFRSNEELIGRDLVAGLKRYWQKREQLGTCPKCGEGTLMIIRSPKTGKVFVGCSGYRDKKCDQTFPLPQKGTIVPMDKDCEFCGHRMIRVVSGRRTWETCINWSQCPGRQEQIKTLSARRSQPSRTDEADRGENGDQ